MSAQHISLFTLIVSCFAIALPSSTAAGLTNAELIKMANAGLSADVIISTIRSTPGNAFDTGVDGLVALKTAKVPDAVLSEITTAPSHTPATIDTEKAKTAKAQEIGPEEILLIEDNSEAPLMYCLAETRTQARGFGYGGVATYNVLRGPAAERRLKSKTPHFIVAVPKNSQVQSYVTLANFAVRKNGNRELMVGGGGVMGVGSFEFRITDDRVVAVTTEKLADQSRTKEGFVLYSVTPKTALARGEYAFVVTPSQAGSMIPIGMARGHSGSPCYDFGVD